MSGEWWNSPDDGASSEAPIGTCLQQVEFDPVTGESVIKTQLDGPEPQPAKAVEPQAVRTCGRCVWGDFSCEGIFGQCRRHAPQPVLGYERPTNDAGAVWPTVHRDDWCGDFA